MVNAVRNALQNIPQRHYNKLEEDIHAAMLKNCKTQTAGNLGMPGDVVFADWTCSKLRLLRPIQVTKVVEAAQSNLFRVTNHYKKGETPSMAVALNKLHLPHSTVQAVITLMPYVYKDCLPSFSSNDSETLITTCHINALAAYLEMYEVANHCINHLTANHVLLIDPLTAKTVLKHAEIPENEKLWSRVRKLILDILTTTDSDYLTDDQVSGIIDVITSLDQSSARYVAAHSVRRTRALTRRTSASSPQGTTAPIPTDSTEAKPDAGLKREDSTSPQAGDAHANASPPFASPHSICEKYHWHFPGEGCFPETKRAEANKIEQVQEHSSQTQEGESRAVSMRSSMDVSSSAEQVAGKKRKAESESDEEHEDEE